MGRHDTVFIEGTEWDKIKAALRQAKQYKNAKDIRDAIARILAAMAQAEGR